MFEHEDKKREMHGRNMMMAQKKNIEKTKAKYNIKVILK